MGGEGVLVGTFEGGEGDVGRGGGRCVLVRRLRFVVLVW